VGQLDSELETVAVWKEPFRTGGLFYLRDGVVRGVLLWNVWGKLDWARTLIREGRGVSAVEREALVSD
jgi:hypothetical protein